MVIKTIKSLLLITFTMISAVSIAQTGKLRFTFVNIANAKPIVLNDSTYYTPNDEAYTIKKLRYYISNFELGNNTFEEKDNYQLIDQAKSTSFEIPVKAGVYNKLNFLLGIDSLHHVSGAQEGALDPMNDMFWTWNTGYVVFKLDGTSPASNSDRNRIEHHIGGYRFNQNVSTPIEIELSEDLTIIENDKIEIVIQMNLDAYWKNISIAENPVITVPNATALKVAQNFKSLFRLIKTNRIED